MSASITMTEIEDPYTYLEDGSDPRTVAWTARHNAAADAYFAQYPYRERLRERFRTLSGFGSLGVPAGRGEMTICAVRRGDAEQSALVVREGSRERVLVDPKLVDPSGLTALDWWYPSPGFTYVAYGLSRNGDELSTLYVCRVADGSDAGEAIPNTRFCSVAWFADESGFFYTRYPDGGMFDARVYRHELGARFVDDPLIFGAGKPKETWYGLGVNATGTKLAITAGRGWLRNDVYLFELEGHAPVSAEPRVVCEGLDALSTPFFSGDSLLIRSNDGAPNYRIFEASSSAPERGHWREIVAERDDVLENAGVAGDAIVLVYLHEVRSEVYALRRETGAATFAGAKQTLVAGHGASVLGLWCDERRPEAWLLDTDFFAPPGIKHVDLSPENPVTTPLIFDIAEPGVRAALDASRYSVTQEWYTSRDGTAVPMFVLTRRGLARDGTAPAIVYGYGGFNHAMIPSFVPHLVPWLDAGGVYAIANLRGGSEFGEAWHRAGVRERKQNVFDDAIAAIEALGALRIADRERVAISGGSNGGLLVATVATQRPDLLRAVHCAVPLTDMLRYHLFLIGRLWIAEYGDPDVSEDAEFLRAYSPYHRVREHERYPAMLFVTAESDTRVDPMHARKMAAKMEAATSSGLPILCHIEGNAGHGAGKPRAKVVSELADRFSFFARELGVEVL